MNRDGGILGGRIAVVGSGAVGCYYGGRLAQGGNDVRFLMRRDLGAVRKAGLHVQSPAGDFSLPDVRAFGSTSEIGPSDLVIIALKSTSNDQLDDLLPPLLHEDTVLLTLQNGLGSDEFLAGRFGPQRVMGGLCFVCLNRTAPGVIHHIAQGQVALGEFDGPPRQRTHELAAEFERCGVPCRVVDSLAAERWKKLAWNVPFNGLSIAGGGMDTERILSDPALNELARALMREVIDGASRLGFTLPDDLEAVHMSATATMGAYRPSSLIDFLAGREVEIEAIWGEPLRRATKAGAAMPCLQTLHALIKSQVASRQKSPS
jgi:2-dehydropantoate 2-reductase